MISIKGLDKATVLAALVNAAKPLGMGRFQDDGKPMAIEEARRWINEGRVHDTVNFPGQKRLRFDYVKGRPLKVDISGDEFDPSLYDRDHGEGAAARVITALR